MPRREKRFHFLYKTTNLLNGKFYVGMHSTDDLDDGYLGSGLRLRRSIRKYGAVNFKREILEFFENRKLMAARERTVVNEKLLEDPLCMNMSYGGEGGLAVNNDGWAAARKKIKELKLNPEWVKRQSENFSEIHKASYKRGGRKLVRCDWTGKKHKDETKKILSQKASALIGDKNSQFGTCWIWHKDFGNKKIKKEEIKIWENNGWIKGRKMVP